MVIAIIVLGIVIVILGVYAERVHGDAEWYRKEYYRSIQSHDITRISYDHLVESSQHEIDRLVANNAKTSVDLISLKDSLKEHFQFIITNAQNDMEEWEDLRDALLSPDPIAEEMEDDDYSDDLDESDDDSDEYDFDEEDE